MCGTTDRAVYWHPYEMHEGPRGGKHWAKADDAEPYCFDCWTTEVCGHVHVPLGAWQHTPEARAILGG